VDTNLPSSKRNSLSSGPRFSGVLSTILSVGVVVWVVGAGVAAAQAPARPVAAEAVSYSDLDISTQTGAAVLLQRIDRAAQRACGPEPIHSPLHPREPAFYDRCVKDAVNVAVARTNAPLMTAMHTGRSLSEGASFAAR
jgi:UrcA family protein